MRARLLGKNYLKLNISLKKEKWGLKLKTIEKFYCKIRQMLTVNISCENFTY